MTKKFEKEVLSILRNIELIQIKENKEERIGKIERELDLVRGNHDELLKRFRAMENYLGVKFISEIKYQKFED